MGQAPITEAQLQTAIEALRTNGGNQTRAARSLGMSRNTYVSQLVLARGRELLTPKMEAEWRSRESIISGRRLPQTRDECYAFLDDWIGRSKQPNVKPPKARKSHRRKYTIGSDLHGPFYEPWAVAEMIKRDLHDTDTLILNGDIFDMYGVSRFIKFEHVPFEMEVAAVDALLGQFSKLVPDILITTGNHDGPRFEKALRSQLSPEMCHVIEYLSGGELDPLKVIAKRYPNVRFAPVHVDHYNLGWLAQEGDLLVTHAEKYSRVPGSALRMITEWLTDFHDALGLKPWRVLVQAHTHAMSRFAWQSDKLLVEGLCLCKTMGYQLTARMGGRPQRRGYVTLLMEDGECDINTVREWWLDADRKNAA